MRLIGVLVFLSLLTACDGAARSINQTLYPDLYRRHGLTPSTPAPDTPPPTKGTTLCGAPGQPAC
jgi:hypothetical protein